MNRNKALLYAVKNGRLDKVRNLLDSCGPSFSQESYSLLCDALQFKHTEVAKLLLKKGSKVNENTKRPSNTPLHLAVGNGDIEIVQMILDKKPTVYVLNQKGRTPICVAIEHQNMNVIELLLKYAKSENYNGKRANNLAAPLSVAINIQNINIIELLLKYGANVNATVNNCEKVLHFAVKTGNLETVRMLLRAGAYINCIMAKRNRTKNAFHGYTPLHLAVEHCNYEVASFLLKEGANVNAKAKNYVIPLHIAVKKSKITPLTIAKNIIELFLDHGADVNAHDNNGKRALHFAVETGISEIVEVLLNHGADIDCVVAQQQLGNNGQVHTPLHFAVELCDYPVVSFLLSRGANVNMKARDNLTPLHIAAKEGHVPLVEVLLNHDAIIDSAIISTGYSPLHIAAERGNEEIVDILLKRDANVNVSSKNNITPLHIAIRGGYEAVVKLLLQHGAQVNVPYPDGKTMLHLAVEKDNAKMVEDILRYCPDVNMEHNRSCLKIALYNTQSLENKKILEALLQFGFVVNPEDANDSKLFHFSVMKGCLEIVKDLLKFGANVNMVDRSTGNLCTPLHSAVLSGQEKIAHLLIRNKADVNAIDKFGNIPIYFAIARSDFKLTELLLANGACIKDHPELLNKAAEKKCLLIVEKLLQYGADVNASDDDGRTALYLTCSSKGCAEKSAISENIRSQIAELLVRKGANLNTHTPDGDTAISVAIRNNYANVVETLLIWSERLKLEVTFDITQLLVLSVETGKEKVCEMLLKKGANSHAKQEGERTLLHIACAKGHKKVMKVLLEYGADTEFRDASGRTALHIISNKGHDKCVETLLEYGADVSAKNENNCYTPLSHAMVGYMSHGYSYSGDSCDERYFDVDGRYDVERNSYLITIQTLLQHLVMLKTANLHVSEKDLNLIIYLTHDCSCEDEDESLDEDEITWDVGEGDWYDEIECIFGMYWNDEIECEEEVAGMKNELHKNSKLSIYDILSMNSSSLAIYLENESIVKLLETGSYKMKFPIYASMIERKITAGMERKKLLEQDNIFYHTIFPVLPYVCIENIMSYLSNANLKMMMEACKPQCQ